MCASFPVAIQRPKSSAYSSKLINVYPFISLKITEATTDNPPALFYSLFLRLPSYTCGEGTTEPATGGLAANWPLMLP